MRLIIFTRYPEPGKTKTRLMPALGAEGAAHLQRQMTEHTLAQVEAWLQQSNLPYTTVEIRFSGGDRPLMSQWLGDRWCYEPQGEGDLGDRLIRAFQSAFDQGCDRVLTIGIDCPEITATILQQATDALSSHDAVLGPATDGGYYLIGLTHLCTELFQGIDWGTDVVLQQTLDAATKAQLAIAQLTPLTDIDRPDDLPIWERVRSPQNSIIQTQSTEQILSLNPKLSIILPTLNEAERIQNTLATLVNQSPEIELIVVDGQSQDQTAELAQASGAMVLSTPPGRAQQMNAGAQIAKADVLLFLHADTQLPPNFGLAVQEAIARPDVVAGAFQLSIDHPSWSLRVVEWGVKWRSQLFQLPYGDQALFMKKETWAAIGGFPDLPIMEDFVIVQHLKKLGRIAILPCPVVTSARRWQKKGILRTTLINQAMLLGYGLGISPKRLAQWYRGDRTPSTDEP